jgi:RNA polymerase sigma-70 factor, ECF subfamily
MMTKDDTMKAATTPTTAEFELVERMRARDESAVADLDRIYRSRVQQLALRYMKNPEDAEEVAQDVLLKVYNKIEAFRGDAALSSWIFRITFNTVMSRLRSQKFMHKREVPADDLLADVEERGGRVRTEPVDWSMLADESLLRMQMREKLAEAMSQMPDIYRHPILLRDLQGLSTEEASVKLGIKEQTLKSRLHRGRLFLRGRLADFASGLTLHRPVSGGTLATA